MLRLVRVFCVQAQQVLCFYEKQNELQQKGLTEGPTGRVLLCPEKSTFLMEQISTKFISVEEGSDGVLFRVSQSEVQSWESGTRHITKEEKISLKNFQVCLIKCQVVIQTHYKLWSLWGFMRYFSKIHWLFIDIKVGQVSAPSGTFTFIW